MTALFEWFNDRVNASYKTRFALGPQDVFKRLGAPQGVVNLFSEKKLLNLRVESFKTCFDGEVPNLEAQSRAVKRSVGRFYTPEGFAAALTGFLFNEINKKALAGRACLIADPACGDGSFLMAAARQLEEKQIKGFLSRLYGCDIDIYALFITLTRLITRFKGCGWPVIEQRDFLLSPPKRQFSAIIGNPPYKVNLSKETKEALSRAYSTAEGELDLYTFFIEAAFRALLPNAPLAFITPHTYLVNHQCGKIRRLVFEENRVKALFMLPARFFKKAPGVLPVCLLARAGNKGRSYSFSVKTDFISGSLCWNNTYSALNSDFLTTDGLKQVIVPKKLKALFKKLDKRPKLGGFCRVGLGIQERLKKTPKARAFIADKPLNADYKPVLRGREIAPFVIRWQKKFISYGPHLAYKGDKQAYEGVKLLYQNLRNERLKYRLVAALDVEGFFPKNSLTFMVSENKRYSEEFFEGLMNSTLINAWFSGHFHSFHITISQVRQIPVPQCAAKKINEVVLCVREIKKLIAAKQDSAIAFERLNFAVCACFGLKGDLAGLIDECDKFLEQASYL